MQPPHHNRYDGTNAQRFLGHGVEVPRVALFGGQDHAGVHIGMVQHEIECPRQRRGRGLVAGDQERDQLVAQLVVGQRPAVVVAGVEQ